eukprot:52246-Chlamydomonas_euryale.AAC.3
MGGAACEVLHAGRRMGGAAWEVPHAGCRMHQCRTRGAAWEALHAGCRMGGAACRVSPHVERRMRGAICRMPGPRPYLAQHARVAAERRRRVRCRVVSEEQRKEAHPKARRRAALQHRAA